MKEIQELLPALGEASQELTLELYRRKILTDKQILDSEFFVLFEDPVDTLVKLYQLGMREATLIKIASKTETLRKVKARFIELGIPVPPVLNNFIAKMNNPQGVGFY